MLHGVGCNDAFIPCNFGAAAACERQHAGNHLTFMYLVAHSSSARQFTIVS
jgi:hypothetical protein